MNTETDDRSKPERVVANSIGLADLDCPIFRIFRADHLSNDVQGGFNTLVCPCEETQGDENENPFLNHRFQFGETSAPAFRQAMSDIYTQSWSFSAPPWDSFGGDNDKMLVTSTPRLLLDGLMDTSNRAYSVSYFIGRVAYLNQDALDQARDSAELSDLLLFNGADLVASVLRLFSSLASEEEVRLIFWRTEDCLGDFAARYPVHGINNYLCSHPFEWRRFVTAWTPSPGNRQTYPLLRDYFR